MSLLEIHVGDVREKLAELPADSVHCVVTSPPYWGLRDYGAEGQLGLEPTPEEHVEAMVGVFREVRRVLRADGTLWLNYGDCYASKSGGVSGAPLVDGSGREGKNCQSWTTRRRKNPDSFGSLKSKDLVMMPARIALALQADGWWLRSEIVWAKSNPMPESCTDRPTSSHEKVYLLAKSARYFYDADAVRERHGGSDMTRPPTSAHPDDGTVLKTSSTGAHGGLLTNKRHPAGRNLRNVWTIATQPYKEAHFATFPEELASRCIKAGSSLKGCCPKCEAPWVRVVEKSKYEPEIVAEGVRFVDGSRCDKTRKISGAEYNKLPPPKTIGWQPSCECDAGKPVPATVLDPFGGSGTTAVAAIKDGRRAVMIELNPEYADLARKRIDDAAGLFV